MIKAADLFCGAGGTSHGLARACERLGIPVDLTAINHWSKAVSSHELNHPWATHYCAQIDALDPRKVIPSGELDLIVAGVECFAGDTLILTARGLVPISEVEIGDQVLTHQLRWRQVNSVMSRLARTVVVRGHGHPGIRTTAEHPFLTRLRRPSWKRGQSRWSWSDPEWTPVANLSEGQRFWGTPCKDNIEAPHNQWEHPAAPKPGIGPLSTDLWWLIGRWLGDGYADRNHIVITCGFHEADDLAKRLNNAIPGWSRRQMRTATAFTLSNTALSAWIQKNFRRLSHRKTIPPFALTMRHEWRAALLDGYVSADGHFDGRKVETCSVSKRLAIGIRLLAETLGHRVALHCYPQHSKLIEGRPLSRVRDLWRLAWIPEPQRQQSTEIDGIAWSRVRSIVDDGVITEVFNLSVEEDESYVADGLIVHNCTHHSKARGGRPISDQSRASAWHVVHWAEKLRVHDVLIENVPDFMSWGPVDEHGKRIKERAGDTFRAFVQALESLNYRVEHRIITCADFGDPTTRRRFFLRARLGGGPITWPEPTHHKDGGDDLLPWRTAREIIDWNDLGTSIFARKKPLAPRTMARIRAGIERFCGDMAEPFLVMFYGTNDARSVDRPVPTVTAKGNHIGVASPFLVRYYGCSETESVDAPLSTVAAMNKHGLATPFLVEVNHGKTRPPKSLDVPMPTVTTKNGYAVASPFLLPHDQFRAKNGLTLIDSVGSPLRTVTAHNGDDNYVVTPFLVPGYSEREGQTPRTHSVDAPVPTVTASKGAGSLCTPFLIPYYRTGTPKAVDSPVPTVTTRDRFALVTPDGHALDIFFRMLTPRELARAQGFPDDFDFVGNKAETVRQIGNAVPVGTAEHLCYAVLQRSNGHPQTN